MLIPHICLLFKTVFLVRTVSCSHQLVKYPMEPHGRALLFSVHTSMCVRLNESMAWTRHLSLGLYKHFLHVGVHLEFPFLPSFMFLYGGDKLGGLLKHHFHLPRNAVVQGHLRTAALNLIPLPDVPDSSQQPYRTTCSCVCTRAAQTSRSKLDPPTR